ncbi:hypothetical protein LSM04_007377 [Trypanosoma melophagium]|uniref:uncharacterized protein n=1 Tax=Trypanosoma melophagium TaxID=715481 RepID=UPI00351AA9F0|nr:hypothetical protein LSM04_007377 [Trypanosoma melophagium]
MPLRFGPGSGRNCSAAPLAAVCTLHHENPVILKTYKSKRNECAPGMRRKPPRSVYIFLPSLTETTQEEKEQEDKGSNSKRTMILPLKQPDLVYGKRSDGSAYTVPAISLEVEPMDVPSLSLPLMRPWPLSRQLLPLLHHNEIPLSLILALSRTIPQRRIQSQACRAGLMREALVGSRVSATWDEMLEASRVAWDSAIQIPAVIPPPPTLPNLPDFSPHLFLPAQMMDLYDTSFQNSSRNNNNNNNNNNNVACCILDSTVVPRWKPVRQPRERSMLRWFPTAPDRNILINWNLPSQALLNQENVLQWHFHETTTPLLEVTKPAFPAVTEILVEPPLITEEKNVHDTFEQIHIVVPCISRMRMKKATRRQECYANIQSTLIQNLSPTVMLKPMERAKELRFPEGKHSRQTLTLRNIAAERLQQEVSTIGIRHNRKRQRKGVVEWFRRGSNSVLQRRDLWTVVLLSSRALSTVHQFGLPKCRDIWNKSENEFQLQPPLLMLSPSMLDGAALVFSYFSSSSSWLPLAVEEVDDGSCCRREDPVLFPLRVFSREEELQSFLALRERGMRWEGNEEIEISNMESSGEGKEEKWYHEAFLHDISTMPLPYRNSVALIEDAKLHYYFRLALHREKERLGLHETR